MKKILKSISFIACLFAFWGCSDFLEIEPYGEDSSWKTQEDVQDAVYALYHFVSPYWGEEICGRGTMWFETASDNVLIGRDRSSVDEIREFRMSPSNSNDVSRVWEVMYQNVAKSNNIIKIVPGMTLEEGFKSQAVGTAYFFRGFSMLWMVPYYGDDTNGGIPIITDQTDPAQIDSPRPDHVLRNYEQIIADLRTAGEMLPVWGDLEASEYGLPHKAAAWGFAARAALYAAQYDASYYNVVIEFCDKIMALTGSSARSLYKDSSNTANSYANLWTAEQNHSSEYIFSLEGHYTNGGKFHGVSFVNAGWGIYNTWGYFTPSKELWDAYESGDTRRDATILYPGQNIEFVGNDITFGGFRTGGDPIDYTTGHVSAGMVFRKFMDSWKDADALGKDVSALRDKLWNSLNISLLRYADVMLMKAEALIWTKGEGDAEAKELINDVRERAGLPRNSQATKAQLQNERRCELAFEFQPSRHLDMVRWGLAQTEYAKPLHSVSTMMVNGELQVSEVEVYPGRVFNPTYNKVFPIPQRAFSGTFYLEQNQGY